MTDAFPTSLVQPPFASRAHGAMDALMTPRSIAVVGASERPGAPAGVVLLNLLDFGFAGPIHVVHPTAASVFGVRAHRRLADIADPIDCVVVGLAADKVVDAIESAAAIGAGAAVVLASGFAELGEAGRARQAALAASARRAGMAICGPNCLGLVNVRAGIPLYSARLSSAMPRGGLAVLSHSGSGAVALSTTGRYGLSYVVSAGNGAVSDLADYLGYLARDEATRAAALFIETVRELDKFTAAMADMHAAGKPVVVLRVGRSASGAVATAAHTGTLAGADEAFGAYFRRVGAIVVDDMDELIETCSLFLEARRRPSGRGVGLINVSGGEIAHACDLAQDAGLALPELAMATAERLRGILPPFATPRNPLDATGAVFSDANLYRQSLLTLAADPGIAVVAASQDAPLGLSDSGAANYRTIAEIVAEVAAEVDKPVVFFSNLSQGVHPVVREPLERAGVPVLHGTRASLRAMGHFVDFAAGSPPASAPYAKADPVWRRRLASGAALTEREAKEFLSQHGLMTTREALARSADEAVAIARDIGFPVALKIESPDLPHKTEIGGVALDLTGEKAVRAAFEDMMREVSQRAPDAALTGILVQEMVKDGVEALIGLVRHEPFGLCVVVGFGGILVEVVRDSALALPPLDFASAQKLIRETRLLTLLSGYRGAPAADIDALANALVAVSNIALGYADVLEAMDINPIAVLPGTSGVRVLDALVLPRPLKGGRHPPQRSLGASE